MNFYFTRVLKRFTRHFPKLSSTTRHRQYYDINMRSLFRPQLDKKSVLEQYDLLALTIDEVIDKG